MAKRYEPMIKQPVHPATSTKQRSCNTCKSRSWIPNKPTNSTSLAPFQILFQCFSRTN